MGWACEKETRRIQYQIKIDALAVRQKIRIAITPSLYFRNKFWNLFGHMVSRTKQSVISTAIWKYILWLVKSRYLLEVMTSGWNMDLIIITITILFILLRSCRWVSRLNIGFSKILSTFSVLVVLSEILCCGKSGFCFAKSSSNSQNYF